MNIHFKDKSYYEWERQEMVRFVSLNVKRLLDVGCGNGRFGNRLKKDRDVEVWGIEKNLDAASVAAELLDKVIYGEFPNAVGLPPHYFDCIQFNDVLEHMEDPWNALISAKKYLVSSGIVVASIPNIRFLPVLFDLIVRGEWNYTESGVLDRTHLRFFTKKGMVEMFENAGYQVERIEGIDPINNRKLRLMKVFFPGFVRETKFLKYVLVARQQD